MDKYKKWVSKWFVGLLLLVCPFFLGCAGSPKEPTSHPSVQDVRGDSDRFFKKMEEEEKIQPSP